MVEKVYLLENLGCANCAKKMEQLLEKEPGVQCASIQFALQELTIQSEKELDPQRINTLIRQIEPQCQLAARHRMEHIEEQVYKQTDPVKHQAADAPKRLRAMMQNGLKPVRMAFALLFFAAAIFAEYHKGPAIYFAVISWLLAGADVLWRAIENLRIPLIAEHFLMSIATIGALLLGEGLEAAIVMLLYQLGCFLEERAVHRSRRSMEELLSLAPLQAHRRKGARLETIAATEICVGDVLEVGAGERIPADGIILDGESTLDTAAITGESLPLEARAGVAIQSGMLNGNGWLQMRATKNAEDSAAMQIIRLMKEAAANTSRTQRLVERFASVYTPIVVLAALFVGVGIPFILQEAYSTWMLRGLTFLVISCPCAFVISVPMSFMRGLNKAAKRGILVKGAEVFERLPKIQTIAFDKTGTLTTGQLSVKDAYWNPTLMEAQKKEYTAVLCAMERLSSHPIAKALLRTLDQQEAQVSLAVETLPGSGLRARYEAQSFVVGSRAWMQGQGISIPTVFSSEGTEVWLASLEPKVQCLAGFHLIDTERMESEDTLVFLRDRALRTVLLSGDQAENVAAFANDHDFTDYQAECLPQDKLAWVRKEQRHRPVLFVGDGLNDAPVLKESTVGVAMGGMGSEASCEAGDIILLEDRIDALKDTFVIADETMKNAKENIVLSLGLKFALLLLSAFGWVPMWVAVFGDMGVSLVAIANALRLR